MNWFAGLSVPVQLSIVFIAAGRTGFRAAAMVTGRISFRKTGRGMLIGAATPFEKTNGRFKRLCDTVEALAVSDKEQSKKIAEIVQRISYQSLDVLRITFYLSGLSAAERMVAGLRYIEGGGNGDTGEDVGAMIRQYPGIYEGIQASRRKGV
jgi:hypothetical protein